MLADKGETMSTSGDELYKTLENVDAALRRSIKELRILAALYHSRGHRERAYELYEKIQSMEEEVFFDIQPEKTESEPSPAPDCQPTRPPTGTK
jgi:hypothetical protein